jgi:hypothetical protein
MSDRIEKRGGNWTDDEDKELARRLAQQAEKDRLAQQAAKQKEQLQQSDQGDAQ